MTKASYFSLQNHIFDFHHRLLGARRRCSSWKAGIESGYATTHAAAMPFVPNCPPSGESDHGDTKTSPSWISDKLDLSCAGSGMGARHQIKCIVNMKFGALRSDCDDFGVASEARKGLQ